MTVHTTDWYVPHLVVRNIQTDVQLTQIIFCIIQFSLKEKKFGGDTKKKPLSEH